MREQLEALGYRLVAWGGEADLYVVNSCTVTGRADRDTRRLARLARRLNPSATVVVSGCYVDVAREQLAAMDEVDLLVSNAEKARLAELLASLKTGAAVPGPSERAGYGGTGPLITHFSSHTRAFVKVQEGCDGGCAYCIIPRARGPARSVPREDVERQVRLLAHAGHREIVLIGTHLGRYGADLESGVDLEGLVRSLAELDCVGRLRLSSIEPLEVGSGLIEALAGGGRALDPGAGGLSARGKLCRHLHLPLQSGSDEVLRAMGRPYRTGDYAQLCAELVARAPGVGLGADVLVGFPGETEELFAETEAFVRSLPLTYLHVFTYSPRPGTPAAERPDQVPPEKRKARNHVLRALGAAKLAAFAQSQVGATLEVVPERRAEDGRLDAISDNYLRVVHPGPDDLIGRITRLAVTEAEAGHLVGRL